MIWEFECLELQHYIYKYFGSRFLKIYFIDLSIFISLSRTLFNMYTGQDSCLDMVHNRKFWPQGSFKIFDSYVQVFAVTSLQESALRSVDMFSRQT